MYEYASNDVKKEMHSFVQSNYDKLKLINKWEMEQFAYLLNKLKSTIDVSGMPLLYSCVIFMSSEISDGNRHNHDNMPVIVAGHANGYLRSGRHIKYTNNPSFGSLFKTLLEAVGAPVTKFGDDGGTALTGLT